MNNAKRKKPNLSNKCLQIVQELRSKRHKFFEKSKYVCFSLASILSFFYNLFPFFVIIKHSNRGIKHVKSVSKR